VFVSDSRYCNHGIITINKSHSNRTKTNDATQRKHKQKRKDETKKIKKKNRRESEGNKGK
jgi:hypothetical protein